MYFPCHCILLCSICHLSSFEMIVCELHFSFYFINAVFSSIIKCTAYFCIRMNCVSFFHFLSSFISILRLFSFRFCCGTRSITRNYDWYVFLFYWILFDSCWAFVNKTTEHREKNCFLRNTFFFSVGRSIATFFVCSVPHIMFFFLLLFSALALQEWLALNGNNAKVQRAKSVRFAFEGNEQVQRNIGVKQKLMIAVLVVRVLSACTWHFFSVIFFFFSQFDDHWACLLIKLVCVYVCECCVTLFFLYLTVQVASSK